LVEALHEHAAIAVIAARFDRRPDLFARFAPATHRRLAGTVLGEAQAAIDGDAAGCLGVHEVSRLSLPLPDAAIGLLPALDRGLDQLDEEAPLVVVGRVTAQVPAPSEVEDLPEGVELQLARGVVAHAHRTRAAVSGELELLRGH